MELIEVKSFSMLRTPSFCDCKVLLIAGGKPPSDAWLEATTRCFDVWVADRGVTYCRKLNVIPKAIVGDGDSSPLEDWAWAEEAGAKVYRYPKDKDYTDLQLALMQISRSYGRSVSVFVTAGLGGRLDHSLSNIFSLQWAKKRGVDAAGFLDEEESFILLRGGEELKLYFNNKPLAISLLSLTPCSHGVSIKKVKWELDNATLRLDEPFAVSNELVSDEREVDLKVDSGCVGVYICLGPK